MDEIDVEIIREVTDEIFNDIGTCGVMNGSRPKKDCSSSCRYRDICDKIFEKSEEMEELKNEEE